MKKKNFIKLATVLTTMTLAIGSLAGCGKSESNTNPGKTTASEASVSKTNNEVAQKTTASKYTDTITLVWYPNESAEIYGEAREEIAKLVEQATGKKVEQKLTTDYAIAIGAIANGTAQIGCNFGAEGFIQAEKSNAAVKPLLINSGASGTAEDARYFSYLAVKEENAGMYLNGGEYSLDNIVGKRMSFVSNSSTSGFKVPTNAIINDFANDSTWNNITVDDLIEGGDSNFFKEVSYGGSHQGSAYNLLSDKCDVAAFCDSEVAPYVSLVSGAETETGSVYEIIKGAEAPFDSLEGVKFTVIRSIPVLNGPYVYNSETLSPEDAKAIQELFTSDEVSNNAHIFGTEESGVTGLYKKKGDMKFIIVESDWFDPIRNMK